MNVRQVLDRINELIRHSASSHEERSLKEVFGLVNTHVNADLQEISEIAHKKGVVLGFAFRDESGNIAPFDTGCTIQYALAYLKKLED